MIVGRKKITKADDIDKLSYVDFLALLKERNRPPGGKDSIRRIALNTFVNDKSRVLHIGCNTGMSTRLISSYTKCRVCGIDISPSMINVAKRITKAEKLSDRVKFEVQDAEKLKFSNASFDLVFSAGSIAFMSNRQRVISEILRVLKYYGFFADTVMYYKRTPPDSLINSLNKTMRIKIQKWDLSYWKNIYENDYLNKHYEFKGNFSVPTTAEIENYCASMTKNLPYNEEVKSAAYSRLYKTMRLFAENHKYLAYAILIYQKSPKKEQVSLFGQ